MDCGDKGMEVSVDSDVSTIYIFGGNDGSKFDGLIKVIEDNNKLVQFILGI